ncbi:MAG: helix-turn-helix domain-containing protein [Ktedonobacteraceae bacterium]|nr:helix-turn-helix domain-containing protein [Ktedonobacteraceae bacterium]
MKSDKIKELYYTAAEARKILDLSDDRFQYWVRVGRIEKVRLPGRKQYLYPKRSVNRLAKRIEAAIIAEEEEGLEFRKAILNDLEEEHALSYLLFGKGAHTVETRKAFMEQNPDIDYHLYKDDELVAFINFIPFQHNTVMQFITGQKRGRELDPSTVEQFVPNKPLECIFMEMATTPTVPPGRRTVYGEQLLLGFSEILEEWGKQGVVFTKFYATSSTPTGIRILRTAHFQEINDLGRGRLAFELDISTSNAKMLREYKEAVEEWEKEEDATSHSEGRKRSRRNTK